MGLDEIRRLKSEPKLPKQKKPIPKMSAKKLAAKKAEKELRGDNDTELVKWHKMVLKYSDGECMRCGAKYDKKDFATAIRGNCHILPKRDNMFPSVAYHPLNVWYASPWCGCHNWYDLYATWEEILNDPKIGEFVKMRFQSIEPNIIPEERHRIPEVLLPYCQLPF